MTISTQANQLPSRVIGVGNIFRGDDAVGILVAQRFAKLDLPGVEVLERSGEGTALMEAMNAYDTVYLVDAMKSGVSPGEILRLEAHNTSLPAQFSASSTHAFGVAEAIEMARLMGKLPLKLIVYGIEGLQYETGQALSPEVEQSIPILINRLREELQT